MKRRIPLTLFCIAMIVAGSAVSQSTVYRYIDKDGKVQFTDMPPPQAKDLSEKRMGGGYVEESQMPYATQMAARRSPVTLYTSTECGDYCTQARALLSKRGIPYS